MRIGKDFSKRMKKAWKESVPEDTIRLFEDIVKTAISEEEAELGFVRLMDKILEDEQRLTFWEQNGGCIGGGRNREAKAFALENAGKSLDEKIKLLNNTQCLSNVEQDKNGTIKAEVACHCTTLRAYKFLATPSLYGCAAGAALYNYQIALGTKLKLKSYGASVNFTEKRRPCSFTFEIAE